jgi:dipeptidyl-peptidase-4
MSPPVTLPILLVLLAAPGLPPPAITVDDVARIPAPGTAGLSSMAWSPDDSAITYLRSPDRSLVKALYAFDPVTGRERVLAEAPGGGLTEDNVSREEALQRERKRERALGLTSYQWAKDAPRMILPHRGDVYASDLGSGSLRLVLDTEGGPALDARISPDGRLVAYVHDAEVFVVPATGGTPRQLTQGAREVGRTHGLAELIAAEEMDRHEGFWWSRDARLIAFTEVDDTHVPAYRIVHQAKDSTGAEAWEDERYPFAGAANARVRLGVVSTLGGPVRWMDTGGDPEAYLARVTWLPDGRLTAQVEDRAQTELRLIELDPATGRSRQLLRETSDVWINLHGMLHPLEAPARELAGGFVWGSERSGFRHLYLHRRDGSLVRALTSGDWEVTALHGVDEERGIVYFSGTRDSPLERHLHAVSIHGGEPRRLTEGPGVHSVVLDHGLRRFVDTWSSLDRPPTVTLRSLDDGSLLCTVRDEPDPRVAALELDPPELVTLSSRDGVTLHGALYRPPPAFGPGPWPTLVSVYGGPGAQNVTRDWGLTCDMRAQHFRRLGFLVLKLDNRGTAHRGLAFEAPIKGRMGTIEAQDQVDGVRWLVARGLADPGRVGVYGWSYGGYMAATCLAREPGTFRAAVAGAPVASWDGYDTHYTERYMGRPQDNPAGYRESAVMTHVSARQGPLLIVHGLLDENVHFRHSARLIDALLRARAPHELVLFPSERHGPRREADRAAMEERVRDFFLRELGPRASAVADSGSPPTGR